MNPTQPKDSTYNPKKPKKTHKKTKDFFKKLIFTHGYETKFAFNSDIGLIGQSCQVWVVLGFQPEKTHTFFLQ